MIRRPLFYGTLAFIFSIIIYYYIGLSAAIVTGIFLLISLFIGKITGIKITKAVILLMIFYILGVFNVFIYDSLYDKTCLATGENVGIKGEVLQLNENVAAGSKSYKIKVKLFELDGQSVEREQIILVNYYIGKNNEDNNLEIIPGDIISVSGAIDIPSGQRNPKCFDYALYLRSIQIRYIMKASSISVCENSGKTSIPGSMYMFRELFLDKLGSVVGNDVSSMMSAILFGQKDEMDEQLIEEFQKNGTAHILAVSGLHIGIIYKFISWLWRWKKEKLYFFSLMIFFFCYMAMASFSVSVVRAVFMVGLHILAQIYHKRYDLSSAAFLTAILMLIKNPMYLFNTGFQMSFLAVLTIALIIPIVRRVYKGMFLMSFSIQIGLVPYTAYMFNYLSLSAAFINIPIIFTTGIIVPIGLVSAVSMELCEPLFVLLTKILAGLCEILKWLNHMTAIDGISVFSVVSPDIRVLTAYYLAMVFFLSEEGRLMIMRKRKGLTVFMVIILLVASFCFGKVNEDQFNKADVVFVDVGQGDCIHFRTKNGGNYLIDGGGNINYNVGKQIIKPYLLKNGVKKLDGIFVTHLHTDHYKGVAELCKEGMTERLFLYEGNQLKEDEILKDTGLDKSDISYIYKGQTIKFSENEMIEVLWPERKSEKEYFEINQNEDNENASSLIFKVTVDGGSFIATGDIDEDCHKELQKQWRHKLKCNILKVAHHGSKYSYSNEFVKAASPEYAVFQVGKNNFGHPNEGVIENYLGNGIMIYRNDEDGAVAFDFKDKGVTEVMTVIRER